MSSPATRVARNGETVDGDTIQSKVNGAGAQTLAELVVRLLPVLQRVMIAEMHRAPHAEGMSLTQFRVLARLSEREYRAAELAEALEVGRSSLTVTTDSLVRRGFVQRFRELPDDRRAVILRLTPAGRVLYQAIEAQAAKAVAQLIQRTTAQERTALETGLAALQRTLSVSGHASLRHPDRSA